MVHRRGGGDADSYDRLNEEKRCKRDPRSRFDVGPRKQAAATLRAIEEEWGSGGDYQPTSEELAADPVGYGGTPDYCVNAFDARWYQARCLI
jgi:hypothetical protein